MPTLAGIAQKSTTPPRDSPLNSLRRLESIVDTFALLYFSWAYFKGQFDRIIVLSLQIKLILQC